MSFDRVVDVSGRKVYLHQLRQHCSPAVFVKSNKALGNAVFQTLSVVNPSDSRRVPWTLRNELLRGTHAKHQVVKVAVRKPRIEKDVRVPLLRQRQVQDVAECVLTVVEACTSNVDLGSLCFS